MATNKKVKKEIKQEEIVENNVVEQEQNIEVNETVATVQINTKDEKYFNIEYKKYNPFIFGDKLKTKHKFHLWYNIIKFSIILITIIFGLLALWFSTQWEKGFISGAGYSFINEDMMNSIFNLDLSYIHSGQTDNNIEVFHPASATATAISEYSLSDFNIGNKIYGNNLSLQSVLIAFSFIGIIMTIPSMVFKNGTAWSLGCIGLSFISMVIVILIFAFGLSDQMKLDNELDKINDLWSQYCDARTLSSTLNPSVGDNQEKINTAEQTMIYCSAKIKELLNKILPNDVDSIKDKLQNDFINSLAK